MQVSAVRCCLVVLFCLAGFQEASFSECPASMRATVDKFLDVTYRGAFIGGSKSAFEESKNLTMDDGFPPAWPIVYINRYKVLRAVPTRDGCRFTISYDRQAVITDSLSFRAVRREEISALWLVCADSMCKVDMADARYGLPPHVGRAGILAWLDKLREGDQSAKVMALQRALEHAPD